MLFKKLVDKVLHLGTKLYHKSYAYQFRSIGKNVTIGRRVFIEYPDCVTLGDNVHINHGAWLSCAKFNCEKNAPTKTLNPELIIEEGTYIGRDCVFACIEKVHIGKSVMFADRCFVGDAIHGYQNLDLPIIDQYLQKGGPVSIGDGSWLGIGAVILPGVTIGKHCIVGANAVVTKSVPDYSIVVGNPARVVRKVDQKTEDQK